MNAFIVVNVLKKFAKRIYLSYIPNGRDNLKSIIIKVLFLASIITTIVSSLYFMGYFLKLEKQNNIIEKYRIIWHQAGMNEILNGTVAEKNKITDTIPQTKAVDTLRGYNKDFFGWIKLNGTRLDNPIYKTDNNNFYLTHNQLKQKNEFGTLFFDFENVITEEQTDKNLVVFGHETKDGSMFGTLKKLRSLDFYKEHPTLEFSTVYKGGTYKIYAIFVLNAVKQDDNGYIYNIYRQNFNTENDFDFWVDEALERSIINTGVDVKYGDDIVTLVTESKDFENARLVIMARKIRAGETKESDTSKSTVNINPKYPKKWYDERGASYPF